MINNDQIKNLQSEIERLHDHINVVNAQNQASAQTVSEIMKSLIDIRAGKLLLQIQKEKDQKEIEKLTQLKEALIAETNDLREKLAVINEEYNLVKE